MSRQLVLVLSETTFASMQQQAEAAGVSVDRLAADVLERQFSPPNGSASRPERTGRLDRLFGSVDLGHPTEATNEGIDADPTGKCSSRR